MSSTPVAHSSSTSLSLIERVSHNDAAAWQRFCHVYGPLVYRWARVAGLQDSDAADVGQEVFRTIHSRIREFEPSRPGATFRGWLRTITRNKIGDLFRRESRRPLAVGGTTAWQLQEALPEEFDDAWESQHGIDSARVVLHGTLVLLREEFEPHTWQAFWRVTIDDCPVNDVAEQLQMTPAAVRQAKYRVLRRLREELGPEFEPLKSP